MHDNKLRGQGERKGKSRRDRESMFVIEGDTMIKNTIENNLICF